MTSFRNIVVGVCIAQCEPGTLLMLSLIFFTGQDFCLDIAIINLNSQEKNKIYFYVMQLNVQS